MQNSKGTNLVSMPNITSKNIRNQNKIKDAITKQFLKIESDSKQIQAHTQQTFKKVSHVKNTNRKDHMLKFQIIEEQQKKKIKLKSNKQTTNNFFPVYTTLMDSQFFKQKNKKQEQKVSYAIFQSLQAMEKKNYEQNVTFQRKKLAPLKKGKNERRFLQNRNVHVSFLSVQKAPFLHQQLKQYDKSAMLATTSIFNQSKMIASRRSFQSTQGIQSLISSQNPQKGAITKQYLSKLAKNKPFIPVLQRYHYFDFLWKISFSNGLKIQFPSENNPKKYKAYIGSGNNSSLIRTMLKRRQSWWTITDKIEQAQFVWTQIKVNNIFVSQQSQKSSILADMPQQLDQQHDIIQIKNKNYKSNRKIMNQAMTNEWMKYFNQHKQMEQKMHSSFERRTKYFKKHKLSCIQTQKIKMHNHIPRNYILGNKKALFATMKYYYQSCNKNVFDYLPRTFHIKKGIEDQQYFTFLKYYYAKQKQNNDKKKKNSYNIWIVKPGEFTNRGNGIIVCHSLQQIKGILKNKVKLQNGDDRTYIVQQYLQRPFLYNNRKFDIRHYMLITFINGHVKGYWCDLGYIRTTSYQYSIKNAFSSVHLTNDAVQKLLPDYGKYERGNKLSYQQFQNYLQNQYAGKLSFLKTIYPQMKNIAYDSMRASSLFMDPDYKGHNFQIFGFDFMIDSKFHPWLIQINTNPCLQLSCPVLMEVIPQMIQNSLKIALDPVFTPPQNFQQKRSRFSNNVMNQNCFQLLFDSKVQQKQLKSLLKIEQKQTANNLIFKQFQKDQQQVYENDGIQLDD